MEVQKGIEIVEVPRAKNFISGIASLRGEIVTVLDLPSLLGRPKDTNLHDATIIRFRLSQKSIAIKVDIITEVINISETDLKNSSGYLGIIEQSLLSNVAYSELGLLLVLDIEKLFSIQLQ
jgi:chemotaxis signal transduction protein